MYVYTTGPDWAGGIPGVFRWDACSTHSDLFLGLSVKAHPVDRLCTNQFLISNNNINCSNSQNNI
jgi:hypothetical protein